MARFIYHCRMSRVTVDLIGLGAIIAFVVLVGRGTIPNQQLGWHFIFFAVFAVAGCVAIALHGLIDMRTRRVQKVVPLVTDATRPKKAGGPPEGGGPGAKKNFGEMEWEIGPRGEGLLPQWLGTLFFLSLAALALSLYIASSRGPGNAVSEGAITFCLVSALIPLLIWAAVVRFRISGPIVRLERPYSLFGRAVSFDLSEIDQVDVTHRPREGTAGKGLTITLQDGRQIEYCEADDVIDTVVRQLRLAIERSRQVPHPLSDDAIR